MGRMDKGRLWFLNHCLYVIIMIVCSGLTSMELPEHIKYPLEKTSSFEETHLLQRKNILENKEQPPIALTLEQFPPEVWGHIITFLPKCSAAWYFLASYYGLPQRELEHVAHALVNGTAADAISYENLKEKIASLKAFTFSKNNTEINQRIKEEAIKHLDSITLPMLNAISQNTLLTPPLQLHEKRVEEELQKLLGHLSAFKLCKIDQIIKDNQSELSFKQVGPMLAILKKHLLVNEHVKKYATSKKNLLAGLQTFLSVSPLFFDIPLILKINQYTETQIWAYSVLGITFGLAGLGYTILNKSLPKAKENYQKCENITLEFKEAIERVQIAIESQRNKIKNYKQ